MIDWHLPNRPIKNCFLHRLPRLQIVCKTSRRLYFNKHKEDPRSLLHFAPVGNVCFCFLEWERFFPSVWNWNCCGSFFLLQFSWLHINASSMTKEFDTNIEQTYQFSSRENTPRKYEGWIVGDPSCHSDGSFPWADVENSLYRKWRDVLCVSKLKNSNFSNKTNISYVTSIFYWPVQISAVFTLKPWNDLKTCRNIVFIKNTLNFKRLLRVVSNFLSNVWIDRPFMPSSDVTTPLL